VQWAVKDPFALGSPFKCDSYDLGNGSTNFYVAQGIEFSSDTANGNALIIIPVIAYDGQYVIHSVSDPVNGAWTSVGDQLNTTDCNCDVHPYVMFNAKPLLRTSWSGTGAVSSGGVLAIGSGSGQFRLGQRILSASTPTPSAQGLIDPASLNGIVTVVSLLSGSLGVAGSTYQLNPDIGSVTFSSESMTTRDFVSICRFTPPVGQSVGDYPGAWLAEISNSDGHSIYFSGHNDAPTGAGTDTVTSGTMSMPASGGLVIGFSFNGGVNNSNAFPPFYYPGAGTGFSNSSNILQYDQGNAICTVEWQHFSSVGTRAATFSPTADSRYDTVAVGFLDHP
jgi:hypothetical protein